MSNPDQGLGLPLSGIGIPAFSTRIVLLLMATGLFPDATIALRLPSIIMKKRIDVKIIPVMVARV
jgi:hypothetical protein